MVKGNQLSGSKTESVERKLMERPWGDWRQKRDDSGADNEDAMMKGAMARDENQRDTAKNCDTIKMMKSQH